MKRHTSATPANVPRSRCRLTRRQRAGAYSLGKFLDPRWPKGPSGHERWPGFDTSAPVAVRSWVATYGAKSPPTDIVDRLQRGMKLTYGPNGEGKPQYVATPNEHPTMVKIEPPAGAEIRVLHPIWTPASPTTPPAPPTRG